MKTFNPELFSQVPTHIRLADGAKLKVFKTTVFKTDGGKTQATAELLEGEDEGKWTTVYLEDLQEVERDSEDY